MNERPATMPRGMRIPTVAVACLLLIVAAAPAAAGDGTRGSLWQGSYVGILAGTGRLSNTIVDLDGFANWGHPGSTLEYDTSQWTGGAFAGRRFAYGSVNLRYELEWMLGSRSQDRPWRESSIR